MSRAGLVTGGAEQLGVILEALVVSFTALVTRVSTVLVTALTLAIALPGASSLAFTIATAHLEKDRDMCTEKRGGSTFPLSPLTVQGAQSGP